MFQPLTTTKFNPNNKNIMSIHIGLSVKTENVFVPSILQNANSAATISINQNNI